MSNGDIISSGSNYGENAVHPPLQAFIAYDDLAAGKQAMKLLGELARKFDDDLGYTPLPWSFKLLANADWQGLAEEDALKSDMLIFATSGQSPVPSSVKVWWEKIITQKHGTDAAVICLSDSPAKNSVQQDACFDALRLAAYVAGLDFFISTPVISPTETVSPQERYISQHHSN